tara:strand:- start:1278 stop:1514 length:237 start_codon:yes stop_codon:yes gene_type:complete
MKKIIIICILSVGICLLIVLSKLSHKASQVELLQKQIHNQELHIEDIYIKTNYSRVDSLYLEIMDLGAQLDSMKLKYD